MRALLRLKPYIYPYRWLILASCLLALPLGVLRTAPVALVQRVIDDLNKGDPSRIKLFPVLFIGLYLINFVVRFGHYYLMRIVVARSDQKLKNDLYSHLLGLSPDYFTEQSTGSLMSRAGTDPQLISGFIINISALVREPVNFLCLLGYAFYLDWRLTLMTLMIFPPLAWVFRATGRNLKRYIHGITQENARLFSTLQESFSGIRIVKAFNLEGYMRSKYHQRSETYANLLLRTAKLEETAHPLVELIQAIVIAGVVYYGGMRVVSGAMTPGELFAFFTAFGFMLNPIRVMNDVNMKINQASASGSRSRGRSSATPPS